MALPRPPFMAKANRAPAPRASTRMAAPKPSECNSSGIRGQSENGPRNGRDKPGIVLVERCGSGGSDAHPGRAAAADTRTAGSPDGGHPDGGRRAGTGPAPAPPTRRRNAVQPGTPEDQAAGHQDRTTTLEAFADTIIPGEKRW